jgi:hypothetical protein
MRVQAIVSLIAIFAGVYTASLAHGQVVQASANIQNADPQKFVIGDWYDVTVQRQGVSLKTSGVLLQMTDEWVVLADVVTATQEKKTGTPVLMYLPYVGSSFRYTKVIVDNTKNYRWVPRNGMLVDRHITHVEEKNKLIFPAGDQPKFGEQVLINYVRDGKPAKFGAEVKGDATEEKFRELMKTVPFDDVLIVQSQSPLTAAELKLLKVK